MSVSSYRRSRFNQPALSPVGRPPSAELRWKAGWHWPRLSLSRWLGARGRATDLNGAMFWVAVATYLAVMQLPLAGLLFYPFSLLGTWAHELGHCAAAEMLSGTCRRLELLPGLGGTAFHHTPGGDGPLAIVSASGLLGPSVVGGLMLVMARRFRAPGMALFGVSAALFYTAFTWSQDSFTTSVCVAGGAVFAVLGAAPLSLLRSLVAQFTAIVLAVEAVANKDYAFVESFTRNGQVLLSDTGSIAARLGGPHAFWASVIMALVLFILLAAYLASRRSDEL